MPLDPDKIAGIRTSQGLTQQQLAARSGVSQGTLSHIERGKAGEVWLSVAEKIAAGLGVKIGDILTKTDGEERK